MKNYHIFIPVIMKNFSSSFFSKGTKPGVFQRNPYFTLLLASFVMVAQFIFVNSLDAQIAAGKCKFLGNIIASSVPSNFTTYWNQVTPENSGKWASVESTHGTMNWNALDIAYNAAKNNGFVFKQHNFVWGNQQPSWIGSLSQADQASAVENWIKSYGERYPNTDLIDVVNEPLHAVPAYKDALGGNGTTGWDWVIWAFQKARAYCPNAKLLINDYNIINSDTNTAQYIAIINLLKDRNLIDGIGEQGHFFETTPIATLTSNLNKLAALGLPIYISEYDVNLVDDNAQLAKYQEQIPVLWLNSQVKGITLWGYVQGSIWRTSAFLVNSDGSERPALTWLKQYVPGTNTGSCAPANIESYINDDSNFTVYPNPTFDGNFSVDLPKGAEMVNILDLGGRLVKTVEIAGQSSIKINLEDVPGVYIVQVSDNQKLIYKKLIIK